MSNNNCEECAGKCDNCSQKLCITTEIADMKLCINCALCLEEEIANRCEDFDQDEYYSGEEDYINDQFYQFEEQKEKQKEEEQKEE